MKIGVDYGSVSLKLSTGIIIESKLSRRDLMKKKKYIMINNQKMYYGTGEYDYSTNIKHKQNNFLPVLLAGLCESSTKENQFDICLGVPVVHFDKYRADLKELLENTKHEVDFNGVNRLIAINNVKVIPEGVGVYFNLNDELIHKFKNQDILLIDFGGITVDVLLINNGEILNNTSIFTGVHDLYNRVKQHIIENTEDERITIEQAQKIVEGDLIHSVNGKVTDLKFIDDLKFEIVYEVIKNMKLTFGSSMQSANWILCGGASKHFGSLFKAAQPNTTIITDVLANAKGFKKILDMEV